MRVLIVEDNKDLASLIAARLQQSRIEADQSETVLEARQTISMSNYAAILLDLGLPDQDGLDLLRTLRSHGNSTPVLIMSARHGLGDRVRGLQEGADDYLAKPFALDELVARLEALLRRPANFLGRSLSAGNVELNIENRQVTVAGRTQLVRLRETAVLELLMRQKGNVVPRRFLEDQLFGIEGEQESNTVDVYVHRLRKHLVDAGATVLIHTIRGVGYILSEDQKRVTRPDPSQEATRSAAGNDDLTATETTKTGKVVRKQALIRSRHSRTGDDAR